MINEELPAPNIPLLRKAVEWAEAEAAKTDGTCMWNQEWFAEKRECGTAYCIAGFAVVTATPSAEVDDDGLWIDHQPASWFTEGEKVLGLTSTESWNLFRGDNSIQSVRAAAEAIAARAGERL